MKNILTISLILFTFHTAHAETKADDIEKEELKEYDVEVIIFEDAHARYINSESWTEAESTNTYSADSEERNVTLFRDVTTTADQTFTEIKPDQLGKQYNSLKRSSEFNVLFRGAWRQPGLDKSQAFDIELEKLTNRHSSRSKNKITGSVKVVLARYLHFYTDLEYEREPSITDIPNAAEENNVKTSNASKTQNAGETSLNLDENATIPLESEIEINKFTVTSHRKMRSKELHYIDHPLVGILVRIEPVEIEKAVESETAQ